MDSTLVPAHQKASVSDPPDENVRKYLFWENVTIIFKTTGMITWFVICLLALLEIKRYFNIDLIPGYDSAIDDVYGAVRGSISNHLD